jgi:uncharacterized membrane protein
MGNEQMMALDSWFDLAIHGAARSLEAAGVAVILLGVPWAVIRCISRLGQGDDAYQIFRQTLGRAILVGLELLVAADIIGTVAVQPTLQNVMVLGLIVLVRTFLSISLAVEVEGRWPWQAMERATPKNQG